MVKHDPAEVLKRLAAYQDENELSNSQLAKLIGIGPSTLSELRGGTYKGSSERVLARIARFLNAEDRRQVDAMPEGDGFEPAITKPLVTVQALCQYAQNRGVGAIVIGDSGVGKTVALKAYAEENPNAFYVPCDETMWGRAQFIRAIGHAVHVAHLSRTFDVRRDIIETLCGRRAVLLIDDAHFLEVMGFNAMQTIHDATRCGFVLVGLPKLHTKMMAPKDADWYAQIRRRCAAMRVITAHDPSRENIIAVAKIAGGGVEFDPGAENLLVEEARVPGSVGRIGEIVALAGTYAGKGRDITEKDIRKAIAFRCGI